MKKFAVSVLCGIITILTAAFLVLLAVAALVIDVVIFLPLAILEEIVRKH